MRSPRACNGKGLDGDGEKYGDEVGGKDVAVEDAVSEEYGEVEIGEGFFWKHA